MNNIYQPKTNRLTNRCDGIGAGPHSGLHGKCLADARTSAASTGNKDENILVRHAERYDQRGDSWSNNAHYCRSAYRYNYGPDYRFNDQGIRRAIVSLYDHRCALCGIRMRTPEGHTVVEAAHIVPWSENHDDLPTNGLCLCRLCHWPFDEGLMGVGRHYEVLVSDRVRLDSNMPGHILTLKDRLIFKPDEERLWPAQNNLNRHRKTCFV